MAAAGRRSKSTPSRQPPRTASCWNSGSGNTEAFIKLVKVSPGEAKAPNNNIQPPTISVATGTGASGTALPEN